jgi:dienelactone hydrolase
MSKTLHCAHCGKPYVEGEATWCPECGAPRAAPVVPEPTEPVAPRGASLSATKAPKTAKPSKPGAGERQAMGGGVLGILAIVLIAMLWNNHWRLPAPPRRPVPAALPPEPDHREPPEPGTPKGAKPPAVADALAPEPLESMVPPPPFPDPGPGHLIEPGVVCHEIQFNPPDENAEALPGQSGKLWLYLPEGQHDPTALPCVLIAAAGSNLITGKALSGDDRAEHLPFVRAGFAVLAYEVDGAVAEGEGLDDEKARHAIEAFLAAQAGLVNAHNALEYVLAKVPQVDPERIYAAGHTSAGRLALLFAENEPRLKGCAALACRIDVRSLVPPEAIEAFQGTIPGMIAFFTRFNPWTQQTRLRCPVFLFCALDDPTVSANEVRDFAEWLQRAGKSVTLVAEPARDHLQAILKVGIPRAITWLKGLSESALSHQRTGESQPES